MSTEHNSHANHRSRMRERYRRCGMDGFAEHEALEVYLYRCLRRMNTNGIAHDLLRKFGSLSSIFSRRQNELYREIDSIGEKTAFILGDSAENMEHVVLEMMRADPVYDKGRVMVFSRYMLRRIPKDHGLILRYDSDMSFRDYTILPVAYEDATEWMLQCLAVTKTGDEIHIRLPEDSAWTSESCLQLGMELCMHSRKLRSVHKIGISGEIEVIYE